MICVFLTDYCFALTAEELNISVNEFLIRFYEKVSVARGLADKPEGVLVFHSVIKAGFGIVREYEEGVLRVKAEKGKILSSPNMSYTFIY